mgnify:FL=1
MTDQEQQQPSQQTEQEPLRFSEALVQAFALIFAVQNKTGRRRLMELAETNVLPVLFAGVVSMIMFFGFCLITSQVVLHFAL